MCIRDRDNTHHQSDVILLSKTLDSKIRKWLIERMTNENNNNYDYDIEYITKLELDSINDEIKEEMKYYLFKEKGINDLKHREKLESLLTGVMVERHESLLDLSLIHIFFQTHLSNNLMWFLNHVF